MADYMAAQITIGGEVSQKLAKKLCTAIAQQNICLEWGAITFQPETPEALLQARSQVAGRMYLRLCDDEVAYGWFDQLEDFLVRHKIPYDRQSEGKYEHDPLFVFFRPPDQPMALLATSNGHVVTHAGPLWTLAAKFASLKPSGGDPQKAIRSLVRQLKRALPPQPPLLPELQILPPRSIRRVCRSYRRPVQ